MDSRGTASLIAERDIIIVGAGFAGLYALHKFRSMGRSATILEAGGDIGGTWYWNRYPGARCDVESTQYSYSFDDALYQEWRWTERFPTQPELLRYISHVAERFDLRRDIELNCRVQSAYFDNARNSWLIETEEGRRWRCRYLVMATGCLSSSDMPSIEGLEQFEGRVLHTPSWPKEQIDFTGKRVALVGTGSTGIQIAPVVARQAEQLFVFQRSAAYSVPARNAPLSPAMQEHWAGNYRELKHRARSASPSGVIYEFPPKKPATQADEAERLTEYERRWQIGGAGLGQSFNDILVNKDSNRWVAEFVRQKIRETVKDPAVAESLCPDYPIFAKRICLDDGYYELFNRSNVALVRVPRSGIDRVTPGGVVVDGVEYAVDTLILATGFDAVTGALNRIDIRGAGGARLKDKWRDGPRAYLGLMSSGFPNLFMITGPGSPSILSNVLVSIEEHVEWIAGCLLHMEEHGIDRIDVDQQAEDDWGTHVGEVAAKTLFPQAASWYMGANIEGKPRVFLPYAGGVGTYHQILLDVIASAYKGFVLSPSAGADNSDRTEVRA